MVLYVLPLIAIDRSHIEYKLITSTKANCIFIVPERNYIKINKYKNLMDTTIECIRKIYL